ncbi:MAG: LPS assembly protein LptD [Idiomarina sp.]|nr:LPS assembly protein LptD [Idiomarina sp.]
MLYHSDQIETREFVSTLMRKSARSLPILLFTGTLLGTPGLAHADIANAESNPSLLKVCRVNPAWLPVFQPFQPEYADDEISIAADYGSVTADRYGRFSGNVEIHQLNQWLSTEEAQFDQWTGQLRAFGGIIYSDGYIAIRAEELHADMNLATAQVTKSEYLLIPTSAFGSAGSIEIEAEEGRRSVILRDGSFTTCPGDRPAWSIHANSIAMNEQESWGTATGAQMRLFDVPVLYIPRFSFPLTDERKSGLLYPTVRSSSRTGLEIEAPWYLNLAPNRDATLTPRLMTQRGTMAMGEYRALTPQHDMQLNLEYLRRDRGIDGRPNRSFVRFENESELSSNWSGYVEFLQTSDTAYINDFGSAYANRADAHLYRRGQLDYHDDNLHMQIQVEDFQMLGPYVQPYRTAPRFSLTQQDELLGNLSYQVFSEFSHFRNPNDGSDYTSRFHIEPTFTYGMQRPGWDWQAQAGYLLTHYQQRTPNASMTRSATRALPEFRTNARIHLERELPLTGGFQTLTPQLQYLYVPFRDQSDIGIYDTILMQDDYYSLFRPRRFTGLDRIADAHQITLGASTSLFDAGAEELLRFSLGQIFYLDESQTQLFDETSRITASNSEVAAELDFRLSQRWFASSAVQYDTTLSLVRKGRAAVEYRKDDGNLIQFNYRRVRGLLGTEQEVEQLGYVASWRLNAEWAFASHWYHDVRRGRTMDALIGLQYDSCCWSVRLSGYRRINRNFEIVTPGSPELPADFDNGVSVQFMITGLGGASDTLIGMLQQGIFGYRRPFYLSN